MKRNYYSEAIDIIVNHLSMAEHIVIAAAKTNPSVIVRAYEACLPGPYRPPWYNEVRSILLSGFKINAIKRCRELTGWGLKECKEYVDRMEV